MDLFFVEAPTSRRRRCAASCAEIPGPCLANNSNPDVSPLLPAAELQAIGYAVVVFPVSATYAVAQTASR